MGKKVSEKRFNEIVSTITEAKNNQLKTDVDGEEITPDKAKNLLEDIGSGKLNKREFKEKYNDVINDLEKVSNK